MPRTLQRLVAWLCLALVTLAGLTPAAGFVVCIEPDGCVRIEVKVPYAACGGCESHEQRGASENRLDDAPRDAGCACIDLDVPSSRIAQRVQRRAIEPLAEMYVAPLLESSVFRIAPAAPALRWPAAVAPRPRESLALLRTVVLVV